MGKRLRSDSDADTDPNISDPEDQSYASSSSPRTKIGSTRRQSKKKTRRDVPNDVSGLTAQNSLHAKDTHVIRDADLAAIRSGLLQWYATVHTSRNMPWRKEYNPLLGRDERAQRAYEVIHSIIILRRAHFFHQGVDIRNHATTNPGCDRHTVL